MNAEIAFGLSYYSKSLFDPDLGHRWGIVLGRQGLKVTPGSAGGRSTTYTTFNFQAGADWRLVGNSRFSLAAGLVGGLSFMSNSAPCNEIFCNLPESVVLFTPSLKLATRISSRVSGVLATKGAVYLTDSESTFPYKSGVIVAIGLEVLSPPRKTD